MITSTNIQDLKNPFVDFVSIPDFLSPDSKDFLREATKGRLPELYRYIEFEEGALKSLFNILVKKEHDKISYDCVDLPRNDVLDLEAHDVARYNKFVREAFTSCIQIREALQTSHVECDLLITQPTSYDWHIDGEKNADDYVGTEAIIGRPAIFIPQTSPFASAMNGQKVKRNHADFFRSAAEGALSMWRGGHQENPLIHSSPPEWVDPNYRLLLSVRAYHLR